MTAIAQAVKQASPKSKIELTERQLELLKTGSKVALAIFVLAGVCLLSAVAPNIFMAVGKIFGRKRGIRTKEDRKELERRVEKQIYYLKRQKYIELVPQGSDYRVEVTRKGRKMLKKFKFDSLLVDTDGQKWNGNWWLVIADIPSKKFRYAANQFHNKLKQMYFYPLQRTAWAYPFDPRAEVDYVATYYKIEHFVTTMEIVNLEKSDERVLLKHFKKEQII